MAENEIERRTCIRFKIPGAAVNYQRKSLLPKPGFVEEFCPIMDISRGGIFVKHKDLYRDLLEEAWRTADSRREVVIAAILQSMKKP